jgi:hypothetical protein
MSIFSSLFSAPEAISKTVDAVIRSGDALVFTEEEKSISNQKKLDWLLKFHQASSGSNIARRLLAVMFSAVFLYHVMLVSTLYLLGKKTVAADILTLITDTLVQPIGIMIAFYFCVAAIGAYKK